MMANVVLGMIGTNERVLGSTLPSKRGHLCLLNPPDLASAAAASSAAPAAAFPTIHSAQASPNDLKAFVGYTVLCRTLKQAFYSAIRECIRWGKPIQFLSASDGKKKEEKTVTARRIELRRYSHSV